MLLMLTKTALLMGKHNHFGWKRTLKIESSHHLSTAKPFTKPRPQMRHPHPTKSHQGWGLRHFHWQGQTKSWRMQQQLLNNQTGIPGGVWRSSKQPLFLTRGMAKGRDVQSLGISRRPLKKLPQNARKGKK